MKIVILCCLFAFTWNEIHAQVLEFDQIEMRYDQGQYRSVYRKARKLLDDPAYDFSFLPKYYLALSKLQLAQNEGWYRRHKYAVIEAKRTFEELNKTHEGKSILRAHAYELSTLKSDINQWLYELNRNGDKKTFDLVKTISDELFAEIPEVTEMKEDIILPNQTKTPKETKEDIKEDIENAPISNQRTLVLNRAQELIGVPYKWAGESPKGFDCSGFTYYLMDTKLQQTLKRRAVEQYKSAKKVKCKNVQPGDFVFFDNGSGVSHVGIVISTKNKSVQMIHASSSIGISIVDIYESSYWKKRIKGFGTFLN